MSQPTYKDLCVNVLLRLGEDKNISGGEIIDYSATIVGYLKAIPMLLEEALALLATGGKYVIKSLEITQSEAVSGVVRYDLGTLAPDFYSLTGRKVYFNDEIAANYRIEGGRYFTVNGEDLGTFLIYYNGYPASLPSPVSDGYELDVDPQVYAILPLYIEGKLRLMGEEDYATLVLSEFEQRRAELFQRSANLSAGVRVTLPEDEEEASLW